MGQKLTEKQKHDGTIRFLMNCFAAFCGLSLLLFLYFMMNSDPEPSGVFPLSRDEHSLTIEVFNQLRSGWGKFELLVLVEDTEELTKVDWKKLNHMMSDQLVSRMEHDGIMIIEKSEVSPRNSHEIKFGNMVPDKSYVLLAPMMMDGQMAEMKTFKIEPYDAD